MTKETKLALIRKDVVDVVAARVRDLNNRGEINFPVNYSPENAMKSAWLSLQETVDKTGRPVLEACTKDSIANALLNMVVQGLNPAKKQGYFIAYGKSVIFQRSYFGSMALCKNLAGAQEVNAQVVYGGDEFEYEIKNSKKIIVSHVQNIKNVHNDNIVAAYCTIAWPDGRQVTDVMTFEAITGAWKQSKLHPIDAKGKVKPDSTHGKFTADMALKTVINHACKAVINSTDDGSLVFQHIKMADDIAAEAEVIEEVEDHANRELIDIEPQNELESDEPNNQEGSDMTPDPAGY